MKAFVSTLLLALGLAVTTAPLALWPELAPRVETPAPETTPPADGDEDGGDDAPAPPERAPATAVVPIDLLRVAPAPPVFSTGDDDGDATTDDAPALRARRLPSRPLPDAPARPARAETRAGRRGLPPPAA